MNQDTDNDKGRKQGFGLILHLHPRKVKESTLLFNLTFGLGGMAALLVVIQVVTGLLLKFHYEPSPENAFNSILNLQDSLILVNKAAAEEYLLKSLSREPDNYDFLYALTTFYLEHKQNSKALPYARQIAEKFPQNPAGNQLFDAAKK